MGKNKSIREIPYSKQERDRERETLNRSLNSESNSYYKIKTEQYTSGIV